ncbi:MAG: putative GPI mannosyltransferase 1 [Streblomastix strix]|uniref:GPI mannosyltransferase I n=1 Tax=Streblomastix strix TaxID=222440 RepID=A0A5J4XAF1_9EUKA|nr:MAG: putative GPI mannosyltransferase 1 [Streblomastix strix]
MFQSNKQVRGNQIIEKNPLIRTIFFGAFAIRLALIVYGLWHDSKMELKYTDIDYTVLTEGSKYAVEGQSPFYRSTYRYSPIYSYLMIPNVLFNIAFGKIVFCALDLACGWFIYLILKEDPLKLRLNSNEILLNTSLWLFNPIVINVSTRGSSESIVTFFALATLYYFLKRKVTISAIFFGLAVHVKIYPILFSLPFVLRLDNNWVESYKQLGSKNRNKNINRRSTSRDEKSDISEDAEKTDRNNDDQIVKDVGTVVDKSKQFVVKLIKALKYRIQFTIISFSTFVVITAFFYFKYGFQCIFEQFLYHVTRTDVRHNFSLFWLFLYLKESSAASSVSKFFSIAFFLPQIILWVALSLKLFRKLPLCLFSIVLSFVMFNKVSTVQYFVWYFSLLPLALPFAPLAKSKVTPILFAVWQAVQFWWVRISYLIELKGYSEFFTMFINCVVFFTCHALILLLFIVEPGVSERQQARFSENTNESSKHDQQKRRESEFQRNRREKRNVALASLRVSKSINQDNSAKIDEIPRLFTEIQSDQLVSVQSALNQLQQLAECGEDEIAALISYNFAGIAIQLLKQQNKSEIFVKLLQLIYIIFQSGSSDKTLSLAHSEITPILKDMRDIISACGAVSQCTQILLQFIRPRQISGVEIDFTQTDTELNINNLNSNLFASILLFFSSFSKPPLNIEVLRVIAENMPQLIRILSELIHNHINLPATALLLDLLQHAISGDNSGRINNKNSDDWYSNNWGFASTDNINQLCGSLVNSTVGKCMVIILDQATTVIIQ